MRVLIACEYSGIVREAFSNMGHYAVSCDLLPTEIPGVHYQGDIFDIINERWDLMIARPPCTYLSNSGVRWLYDDKTRWAKMTSGALFFKRLLNSGINKICIENPIMHGYAKNIIGKSQSQCIQPYMFGHRERKATCLWLKNLPLLQKTFDVKKEMELLPENVKQRLFYLPPGEERAKERSKTFTGIAEAMASQWG